jgi:hypothetical protein
VIEHDNGAISTEPSAVISGDEGFYVALVSYRDHVGMEFLFKQSLAFGAARRIVQFA